MLDTCEINISYCLQSHEQAWYLFQGGYSELKEAEMAYERNNMLIQETCEVVNNVALERDTKTEVNMVKMSKLI